MSGDAAANIRTDDEFSILLRSNYALVSVRELQLAYLYWAGMYFHWTMNWTEVPEIFIYI